MDNERIIFPDEGLFVNIKKIELHDASHLRDLHFHGEIEFVCVDLGELICVIGEEKMHISEGEYILINKRVIHKLAAGSEDTEITYMQIDTDKYTETTLPDADRYLSAFINSGDIDKYKKFHRSHMLAGCFEQIEAEFFKKDTAYEKFIQAEIYKIIAVMSRENLLPDNDILQNNKQLSKIMPAIRFAEENFKSEITLDDACKAANLDKYYFCKLFRKTVGATFFDYVNFLRISHTESLLSHTNKNISEAAYESGFSSIQYFNRLFKRHYGIAPCEYRKMKRQQ